MTAYEEVLDHLLFHKALEEDHGASIDRYVGLLQRVQEGYLAGEDGYERSVAAALQLVVEEAFDPWDIDLARFTKAYLKRLRRLGSVNFGAAGRVVLLAWSVLNLQTQRVLAEAEPVNPPAEPLFEAWDVTAELYQDPEDVDFTHQILAEEEPPLQEVFHRDLRQPVTLLDLLDAFSHALEEASGAVQAPRPRRRPTAAALRGKVHKEDLEEDLQATWERIRAPGKEVVGFSELCNGNRWDRATVFLSILFLAKIEWLEIWQEEFPLGEVFLRPLEDAPEVEVPTRLPAAEVA